MASASITAVGKANTGAEARFRKKYRVLPVGRGIPRLARMLWPERTAAELALRTGTTERACRDVLARRAIFSMPALVALLQSDDGFAFLEEVMGAAKPAWWKWARRAVQLGEMRRLQELQRKRIEQLELKFARDIAVEEVIQPRRTRRA